MHLANPPTTLAEAIERLIERTQQLEAARHDQVMTREALEACRVFVTPLERHKGWNEYKQDAADRIARVVGPEDSPVRTAPDQSAFEVKDCQFPACKLDR